MDWKKDGFESEEEARSLGYLVESEKLDDLVTIFERIGRRVD